MKKALIIGLAVVLVMGLAAAMASAVNLTMTGSGSGHLTLPDTDTTYYTDKTDIYAKGFNIVATWTDTTVDKRIGISDTFAWNRDGCRTPPGLVAQPGILDYAKSMTTGKVDGLSLYADIGFEKDYYSGSSGVSLDVDATISSLDATVVNYLYTQGQTYGSQLVTDGVVDFNVGGHSIGGIAGANFWNMVTLEQANANANNVMIGDYDFGSPDIADWSTPRGPHDTMIVDAVNTNGAMDIDGEIQTIGTVDFTGGAFQFTFTGFGSSGMPSIPKFELTVVNP